MYIINGIDIDSIVCEMINIESGELRYVDNIAETPPYDPYPLLQNKKISILPRSQCGYILCKVSNYEQMYNIAKNIKEKLETYNQSWLKREMPINICNDFSVFYRKPASTNTSINTRAKTRHMIIGKSDKIPKPSKLTVFTWYFDTLTSLHQQLFIHEKANDIDSLFTIVCDDESLKVHGYLPRTLNMSDMIVNVDFIKTWHKIKYTPEMAFKPEICGKLNHEYRTGTTIPGHPIHNRFCGNCNSMILETGYSNVHREYICDVCFHYDSDDTYTQHHSATISGSIDCHPKIKELKRIGEDILVEILLTYKYSNLIERTFKYKNREYHIVEGKNYCCVDIDTYWELIGVPKFTDKPVVRMDYKKITTDSHSE